MISNYLRIAIRHLWHNKLYSAINVGGLAAGICCVLLAVLFIQDERSYDRFHANNPNLYRVTTWLRTVDAPDVHLEGGTGQVQGPAFAAAVPEIKKYVRVLGGDIFGDIRAANKALKLRMLFVDEPFFEVFTFPLLHGDSKTALREINSAVITETVARKYFNRTDVVGEIIDVSDDPSAAKLKKPMIITGVAKDPPRNSSIQFDILFPMSFGHLSFYDDNWLNAYLGTYIVLDPRADTAAVVKKFGAVYAQFAKEQIAKNIEAYGFDPAISYGLQPITDVHLNPLPKFSGNREAGIVNESRPLFSQLFLGIAIFILLMAAINFINISIAGSLKRAKEVGVRKVSGGSRIQIILQFLVESSLLCCLAFFLAFLFTQLALPLFNELSGKEIVLFQSVTIGFISVVIMLLVAVVLLTSIYPAYILAGFKAATVLYQKQRLTGRRWLGKSLVVFQFALAIFFVIATIIYYRQMDFIRKKDLGYNPENTIYSWVKSNEKLTDLQPRLRAELAKVPSIKLVAFGGDGNPDDVTINDKKIKAFHKIADENLLAASQITLKAGRNFSSQFSTDKAKAVIVNEAFVKASGLGKPIGTQIRTSEYYDKETKTIIGVVEDFHFQSLREPIKPMVIIMSDWASGGIWVRFENEKRAEALAGFEAAYKKVMPNQMFEYFFVDEFNALEYKQDERWQKIVSAAAGICMLICCLGLFGLAHLAALQRVKEVGIRKVLGASVTTITALLSKDFLKLVLISFVVASPLAAWVMDAWLQNYAYRVNISWWIFALAAVIAVSVAAATVGVQAVRSALANPIDSLRNE
jgi:putative ABC transport system permease protein